MYNFALNSRSKPTNRGLFCFVFSYLARIPKSIALFFFSYWTAGHPGAVKPGAVGQVASGQ